MTNNNTQPSQQVPSGMTLTDEQIIELGGAWFDRFSKRETEIGFARAIERAVLAAATPGQVEESIEEDVYSQIVELMQPHVNADCVATSTSLPASVTEAFAYLLDFWKSASVSAVQPVAWLYESESRGVDLVRKPFCAETLAMCPPDMKVTALVPQRAADADAVDAKLQSIYTLLMRGNIEIGEAYLTLKVVGVPPTMQEFCAAMAQSTEGAKG